MIARGLRALPPLLLAAAVAEAVLWEGGYAPGPRWVFGGLALAALIATAVVHPAATRRLLGRPVVLVLGALGLFGALSAAWTIADAGAALRWGLVTLGYGAIVVVAGVIVRRRRGLAWIAGIVCALAGISGVVGLVAACTLGEPFSDLIRGSWRPGGTLEYSAALALLQVTALPALLSAMCSGRQWLAIGGAAGAMIAGSVLGLADSRAELVFAGVIGVGAVAYPRPTLRTSRGFAIAAVLAVVAVAVLAHLIAGGHYRTGFEPGGWRLAGLGAGCVAVGGLWALATTLAARRGAVAFASATASILVLALGIGAASGAALRSPAAAHPRHVAHAVAPPPGGLLHGRLHLWNAAVEAFADHPVAGSGADSFILATARYQPRGSLVQFAHDLPLELAAELGVFGILGALALYTATGTALWRGRRRRAAWLLGPGSVAFLAAGLIDWPWHLAGSGAVWAACTGAVVGSSIAAA